jgi:hypothetical protein
MSALSQATVYEIGIFEPDVYNPLGDHDLSVYRDVDVFCQHVEDVISVRGPETVRDNLHLCLRGAANRWWSCELDINKKAIRDDKTPWLGQWICRLQDRFRQYAAGRLYSGHLVTYGLRRYYTSDLIVDDPHPAGEPEQSVEIDKRPPAGDIFTRVDAPAQAAAEDASGDVHTSVNAFCQHAKPDAIGSVNVVALPSDMDNYHPHPAGDTFTSIKTFG